ncbi:MAG TPA: cytochrome o ubiquinol oxidase subunit III [Stellaceae bacterium]|jgi:cytochrome o ubiquinol oxidase subunit 3|nr:cytochrome o ubiquinol oxidase subunit III [Stellaceae bacterium]
MTAVETAPVDFIREGEHAGPASTRTVVGYGFWIFLLSDIVMFSGLFAAYAVLWQSTAGGPTGKELFNLRNVFIETMCLLVSSYTAGLGALSAERQHTGRFYLFSVLTFILGAAFLFIEISEFVDMVAKGAGPSRSAFLSAFFTLVGMHGAHVTSGLLWLIYMVAQVAAKGLQPHVLRRLLCFSLFWHALDIIWVGVFTLVYLMGAR